MCGCSFIVFVTHSTFDSIIQPPDIKFFTLLQPIQQTAFLPFNWGYKEFLKIIESCDIEKVSTGQVISF